VQVGDAVVEGQLLISGVVDSTAGPLIRHAAGRILAETDRVLEARVPLTQTLLRPTGEVVLRPSVRLFRLVIPLFTDGDLPDTAVCESADCPLTIRSVPLPVGMLWQRYRLMSPQVVRYTEQEAAALAQTDLQTQEQALRKGTEILTRKQETRVEDGVLILTARLHCLEDIGVEQPLLLGNTAPAAP
jgi:similar to stage IV sporulation protein